MKKENTEDMRGFAYFIFQNSLETEKIMSEFIKKEGLFDRFRDFLVDYYEVQPEEEEGE